LRFLVDNALSPELARLLRAAEHDTVHVRDYGMQAAADSAILQRAAAESRIIVSADSDLAMLLATAQATTPSFILFREPEVILAADYARLLLDNLPAFSQELLSGCVVTFRHGRIRVRTLPLISSNWTPPDSVIY